MDNDDYSRDFPLKLLWHNLLRRPESGNITVTNWRGFALRPMLHPCITCQAATLSVIVDATHVWSDVGEPVNTDVARDYRRGVGFGACRVSSFRRVPGARLP